MPILLEITLILVLVVVAAAIVPLLIQLGRTAKGAEMFFRSAQQDLSRVAEDARASRLLLEKLGASLQVSLDEVAGLARAVGDTGRMVRSLQAQCQSGLDTASRLIGMLLGVLDSVRDRFGRKPDPKPEADESCPELE